MRTKNLALSIICLIIFQNSFAQVKNSGAVITLTSGSSLVINGLDYINETGAGSNGDISLAGTIYIDGDWTNNATAGQLLDSTASAGSVVFNGSSTQAISGRETHFYNLTVNSGASVDVSAGKLVKVYNNFTNNGDFTLKANSTKVASLIDAGSSSNLLGSGNYKMERYIPSAGWHYVSSPLTKASSTTNVFWGAAVYSYTENAHSWQPHYANEQLDVMKGYDIYYKTANPTVSFSGIYNTGNQSISLTKTYDGYNFVGNPYPCTIDWDATSGWTKTNINNAIYIWDATLLGGLGDYMEYVGGVGNNGGSRYIPPTQAFFVFIPNGYTTATLGVSNAVKVNKTSTPFRKSKRANYIKFKVTEGTLSNSTILRLDAGATKTFDGDMDAYKIFHSSQLVPQLFTVLEGTNYSINSIGDIHQNTSIPMNYRPGQSGNHTIEIDLTEFEELIFNYDVVMEDTKTGLIVDLKQQSTYPFHAEVGDSENRFLIHIALPGTLASADNKNTTSINKPEEQEIVNMYALQHAIIFISNQKTNGKINVYDVSGKLLIERIVQNETQISIDIPVKGVYLLSFEGAGINKKTKVVIQ